jgi:hypothetical protein
MSKMDNSEIQSLLSSPIASILIEGLAQTYLSKPQFPIDFLSKWLLNYNQTLSQEKRSK